MLHSSEAKHYSAFPPYPEFFTGASVYDNNNETYDETRRTNGKKTAARRDLNGRTGKMRMYFGVIL